MVAAKLLDLPDELLLIILLNLPSHSILACRVLCRRLSPVTYDSKLQHRIWSTERGIQELSPSGLSFPEFVENVWRWERDWLQDFYNKDKNEVEIRLMKRPSQGVPGLESLCPTNNNFFMRSGYLIQMHQNKNPGWSHMRPSLYRKKSGFIANSVWTDVRLGDHLTMGGWALDLDQDLVAASLLSTRVPVGSLEIQLIHFTTGKRHEYANMPVVRLDFKGRYDWLFRTHIEIMGNYLVILIAHKTSWHKYQTLYLVDWIKGHVVYQQLSRDYAYFPVLTSISEDTFVLGLRSDWALALCRITREGDALTFCTLCRLKLPDVLRGTRLQLENFNRAPSGPDNPSVPKLNSTLPFRNSPSESVLSFYVRADCGQMPVDTPTILFFYVNPSALRDLAKRPVTAQVSGIRGLCHRFSRWTSLSSNPKTQPDTVPWENWGPKTTRWIKHEYGPGPESVHQSLSGTRCAISKGPNRNVEARLLDFNPRRVRDLDMGKPPGWETLLKNSRSIIPAGKHFKYDIVSHLPYTEIAKKAKGQLLIDDQWVVQVKNFPDWSDPILHTLRDQTICMRSIEESRSKKPR